MDNVLEHLTEGQDLVAATEAALSVSYPTVKTLNSNARWANEWRRPVAAGDIADSQELRDIVGLLVFLCSMMTDKCLLYELKAYDYSHEELWNALSDVRGHFDPGRTSYWSDHVFADFPGGGFRGPAPSLLTSPGLKPRIARTPLPPSPLPMLMLPDRPMTFSKRSLTA